MREILFRGWSEFLKEWEFGSLYVDLKRNNYYIMFGRLEMGEIPLNRIKVVPESVGQFTGIIDKNGVKIFEGDIVSYNNKEFIVEFNQKQIGFVFVERESLPRGDSHWVFTARNLIEVVGSTYGRGKGNDNKSL